MNRLDRLSAIIIQLQSRKIIRAQDIADRYAISLRTVYRDIRSLEESGIPIIGEAGVGYSLLEGYRLPPVMFSREEATAFLTAEKLVNKFTDAANSSSYTTAMDKVRAVLKNAEKDYLENIDSSIEVLKSSRPPVAMEQECNPLQDILQAIAAKKVLDLHYFAYYRQEDTRRQVEPVGVFYLDNYWHLIAFCRERKAYRDFRFDRIKGLRLTELTYVDAHPSLKDYLRDVYKDYKLEEITLQVEPSAYLHFGEQKYYQGFVSDRTTAKGVEVQFMTMSIEGFARWYLGVADFSMIVHSDKLKKRVKELFAAIAKKSPDLLT
jgi:predicted DNA-binding transcriptional regulator YafY